MRRGSGLALVVVGLLVAACSGSDGDGVTTEAPVVTTTVAEEATTTAASTTTEVPVSTSTTTEPPPPPTTLSDAEVEDQLKAEVEAAYLAAYDAYHAALLDPADPALRARLPEVLTGDALDNTVRILDELAGDNIFAIENPDLPATATVTSDVNFLDDERTRATFTVCEINSELFFEDGGAPDGGPVLLRETIFRVDLGIVMQLVDGGWKQDSGGNSVELPGVETCDGF